LAESAILGGLQAFNRPRQAARASDKVLLAILISPEFKIGVLNPGTAPPIKPGSRDLIFLWPRRISEQNPKKLQNEILTNRAMKLTLPPPINPG
jgi:hypothetical protein